MDVVVVVVASVLVVDVSDSVEVVPSVVVKGGSVGISVVTTGGVVVGSP